MIELAMREVAGILHAPLHGPDRRCVGVGTDTRRLRGGELFVALRGARYDAHELLPAAEAAGAAGAVLQRPVATSLPHVITDDSRRALGTLARAWRCRRELPVIAITGSNGKTTVKELCAAILARGRRVLATRGNFNNDIGVPLTLFELGEEHDCAVIELGANHPGEIRTLAGIARPTVAVVTVCAPAHLEGFGSIEGVAAAKGEIFEALPVSGPAVINGDDAFAAFWRARVPPGVRVLRFGLAPGCEFRAGEVRFDAGALTTRFTLHTPDGPLPVELPLPGLHNVRNALAAAACASAAGAGAADIVAGLALMQGVRGRLQRKPGRAGATLIDDSYNANPGSVQAAIEVLAACHGRRILVLGDMGELGAGARALHAQAGAQARAAGIDLLVTVGSLAQAAADAFGSGARHCADADAAAAALRPLLDARTTVLVKASRAMQLERLVALLAADGDRAC